MATRLLRRDEVVATLRAHEARLRELGVLSLALFGSVARDEATPDSDVDLLVDLEPLDFNASTLLRDALTELLHSEVDVVSRKNIKPRVWRSAERSLIDIFPSPQRQPSRIIAPMAEPPRWALHIETMIEVSGRIQEIATRFDSVAGLRADRDALESMSFQFVLLGEAAGRIPASVTDQTADINWNGIRATRNAVVHAYDKIDFEALWRTATVHVPAMLPHLRQLLAEADSLAN